MGFFGNLFGKKTATTTAPGQSAPRSEVDEIKHQIETTEGELHEAQERLSQATDNDIKESLEFLVSRKTQALKDLEEKLHVAEARAGK